MNARIDCKECDSEWDERTMLVYFCPLHIEAASLLATLRNVVCMVEMCGLGVGTPAMETKANLTMTDARILIARASRTWQQMLDDDRAAHLARMKHEVQP